MKTLVNPKQPFGKAQFSKIQSARFLVWEDAFEVEFEDGICFLQSHHEIKESNSISAAAVPIRVSVDKELGLHFEVNYDTTETAQVSWAFVRELPPLADIQPQEGELSEALEYVQSASTSRDLEQAYVSKLKLEELRNKTQRFFEKKLDVEFKRIGPSLLLGQDNETALRYSFSRPYRAKNYTQFWFALHDPQIAFLNSYKKSFCVFVCVNTGIVSLAWADFAKYVDKLAETSAQSGHWHHVILRHRTKRMFMRIRGLSPSNEVDMTKWFMPNSQITKELMKRR